MAELSRHGDCLRQASKKIIGDHDEIALPFHHTAPESKGCVVGSQPTFLHPLDGHDRRHPRQRREPAVSVSIGNRGGVNSFRKAGGIPLSFTDPSGLIADVNGAFVVVGVDIANAAAVAWTARAAGTMRESGGDSVAIWMGQTKTPNSGPPGSTHTNPGSGQHRHYGPDGQPEWDIDYDHDHGQGAPHGHNWEKGKRGPGVPISPLPTR